MDSDYAFNITNEQYSIQFNDFSQVDLSNINSDALLSLLEEPTFLPQEAAASLSPLLSSPTLSTDENFNVDMFVGTSDQSSPEMSPAHEPIKSSPTSSPAVSVVETNTKTKKGRNRKRQRKDEDESTDVSAVTLTREQLLHFSSNDLDMFARNLATVRPLRSAEEKELKRQRRLIKNRESAQASRERKKVFVDELQDQINELRQENAKLLQAMDSLRNENKSLRDELSLLYKHTSGKSQDNDNKLSFGDLLSIKKPSTDSTLSNKIKTAGVTLLIILFSFGLFFNNLGENRHISLPAHLRSVREQIPTVLHSSVSQPLIEKFGRQLKEVSDEPSRRPTELLRFSGAKTQSPQPIRITPEPESVTAGSTATTGFGYTTSSSTQLPKTTADVMTELNFIKRTDSSPISQRNYNDSAHTIMYRKVGTDHLFRKRAGSLGTEDASESVGSIFMSEFANESTPTNGSQLSPDAALSKWFNEHVEPQPNTAYLACSDVQQIIPPNAQPFDPKSPFYVSFLIPSQQTEVGDSNVTLMMEITAQVIDIGVSQFSPATNRQTIQIPVM